MSFEYNRMEITVWNKKDNLIFCDEVNRVGRFGVIQDYTIGLKRGKTIELHVGVVEVIAKEWIRQNHELAVGFLNSINNSWES
jgi:hypothetical protein